MKFQKRAKVVVTSDFRRRIWKSDDKSYRVSEIVSRLGESPPRFYAEKIYDKDKWDFISVHRTKEGAERACETDQNS